MTDVTDTAAPAVITPTPGQSQWALIWREFRHRRLAIAGGCFLIFVISLAVFAPFIANDQPLAYHGINYFDYSEARRTLRVVAQQIANGDEVSERLTTIRLQADLMKSQLPPEHRERVDAIVGEIETAAERMPDSQARAAIMKARIAILRELDPRKIELMPQSHWPVLASLNALEVFFMLLVVALLSMPVWRFAVRKLVSRNWRSTAGLICWLGVPLVGSVVWWFAVPDRIDRTPYKDGLMATEFDREEKLPPVEYHSVDWPVIRYALDEANISADYLAPVWFPEKWTQSESQIARESDFKRWDSPHWLGTDSLGRDLMCRMIWGGRVSLSVGIVAVSIYVAIGIVVGAVAGYFRGWVDLAISRLIEIVICFPHFFLILTIVAFLGPSILNIMVVIGLTGWTGVARLVRAEFLRLTSQEFVMAGRALGYSSARIIFRHVLPNALAPVLVSATFGIAGAILTESALSFLGLGITVPTPSWGGILSEGRTVIDTGARWILFFPGFAIFFTITSYNLVGEALRDASDPRLRGQHVR